MPSSRNSFKWKGTRNEEKDPGLSNSRPGLCRHCIYKSISGTRRSLCTYSGHFEKHKDVPESPLRVKGRSLFISLRITDWTSENAMIDNVSSRKMRTNLGLVVSNSELRRPWVFFKLQVVVVVAFNGKEMNDGSQQLRFIPPWDGAVVPFICSALEFTPSVSVCPIPVIVLSSIQVLKGMLFSSGSSLDSMPRCFRGARQTQL